MRSLFLLMLCFALSGCANLLTPTPSAQQSNTWHSALVQLVDQNNTAAMKALADSSDRALAKDARLIMKLHAETRSDRGETQKQLAALREENRQLKEKLNELSQLHLDLDRRTP